MSIDKGRRTKWSRKRFLSPSHKNNDVTQITANYEFSAVNLY